MKKTTLHYHSGGFNSRLVSESRPRRGGPLPNCVLRPHQNYIYSYFFFNFYHKKRKLIYFMLKTTTTFTTLCVANTFSMILPTLFEPFNPPLHNHQHGS